MSMKYLKNIGNQEFKKNHDAPPNKLNQTQAKPNIQAPELIATQQTFKLRFNRWTIIGIITCLAIITIISVTNVIQVNSLLKENDELHKQYKAQKQTNELLVRQINYLESPERITKIAKEKLGMQVANQAPKFVNQ